VVHLSRHVIAEFGNGEQFYTHAGEKISPP
jgi:hypothetical protein